MTSYGVTQLAPVSRCPVIKGLFSLPRTVMTLVEVEEWLPSLLSSLVAPVALAV